MANSNYITSLEMAAKIGVTKRNINYMCQNGKIDGARKVGNRWMIPEEFAQNYLLPDDAQGSYLKAEYERTVYEEDLKVYDGGVSYGERTPLPIGVSDFCRASSQYYYVDKTLMIKELLDRKQTVSLFTRPRRFGKTLNMDMLRVFFEKNREDTSRYFTNTKIWAQGELYRREQGRYPVIYLTFKDVKYNTWEGTRVSLQAGLQAEFRRHLGLLDADRIADADKAYMNRVLRGELEEELWTLTLENLSRLLHEYYGTAPMIIIDEYDTPIHTGYMKGFYEDIVAFMRNFLSATLKDNKHMSMAFLTGILRVAKESIFSGLNNLKVYSILEQRYSQYFGFTEEEVQKMLTDFGQGDKLEEARKMYNGYCFGNQKIYNPWSVLNYVDDGFLPRTYWQHTGSNEIIGDIIGEASDDQMEEMRSLLSGDTVESYIDTTVVYPSIRDNPSSVYSFLLMAGYLTIDTQRELYDGNSLCKVRIPNQEMMYVFEKEILTRWSNAIPQSITIGIKQALFTENSERLQRELERFMLSSISYFDTASESFYHGMLLGMSMMMHQQYLITSNRESGSGRYDIALEPRNAYGSAMPCFIIEVKAARELDDLQTLAQEALRQIDEKGYAAEFAERGTGKIVKFGIAFYKKECAVVKA